MQIWKFKYPFSIVLENILFDVYILEQIQTILSSPDFPKCKAQIFADFNLSFLYSLFTFNSKLIPAIVLTVKSLLKQKINPSESNSLKGKINYSNKV